MSQYSIDQSKLSKIRSQLKISTQHTSAQARTIAIENNSLKTDLAKISLITTLAITSQFIAYLLISKIAN